MSKRKNALRGLFDRLSDQEFGFQEQEFVSPVIKGQKVRVRMADIVMSLKIQSPKDFEGWGIFRPVSFQSAVLIREPSMTEKLAYMKMFPVVRLVLSHRRNGDWIGVLTNNNRHEIDSKALVPVSLVEGCQAFDSIQTRFDGNRCWFEKRDPRRSPRVAHLLRNGIRDLVDPGALQISGLLPAEELVYKSAWAHLWSKSDSWKRRNNPEESRIKDALKRGGAKYRSHRTLGDVFVVEYEVNGQVHRSTVDTSSLSIQSAGFCLDGYDANFDLQSLVGVAAEGHRTGQIYM